MAKGGSVDRERPKWCGLCELRINDHLARVEAYGFSLLGSFIRSFRRFFRCFSLSDLEIFAVALQAAQVVGFKPQDERHGGCQMDSGQQESAAPVHGCKRTPDRADRKLQPV